jgi:hypothetical protein
VTTFQRISRKRLHPVDLYHMIDWLKDGWDDDEHDVAVQIARLKWHLLEMPDRFHARIVLELDILTRARIVNGVPWEDALHRLGKIVAEWNRSLKVAA